MIGQRAIVAHKMRRILIGLVVLAILVILTFTLVFFAVKYGWTNVAGTIDTGFTPLPEGQIPAWSKTLEWQTLATALAKDQAVIAKVSQQTGVPARLIVAMIVPEQLRLYFSEREIFKQVFSPLKILGNQVQFSWGVAGLKQETAKEIERRDTTHLLDFTSLPAPAGPTRTPDEERFNRITDEHNHYYSYLYVALYLKEIEAEWRQAGFDISDRPEILATLFNIGFAHSQPKANPQVGGAEIEINDQKYSFGAMADQFYTTRVLLPTIN